MSAAVTTAYQDANILVAEDQSGVAVLIQKMVLSRLGAGITLVDNGDAALQAMSSQHFDVLVADMMMPGVHGLDLVRAAREQHPDTAVIVMTGYAREFPYVEAIQAGAQDFINKPFAAMELEAKLLRVLREQSLYRELRIAESKYRSLFELSGEGMLLLTAEDFRILDSNHSFSSLCGLAPEVLTELHVADLFDSAEQDRVAQVLSYSRSTGQCTVTDLTLRHAQGHRIAVDLSITHINNGDNAFVFMGFRDVTEKREVEQRLADVAQKDELTGLFNRRSFTSRIEGALARARDQRRKVALVLIDLDNFKSCNDTHGHQVGDHLLTHVGEVIRNSIRQSSLDKGYRCGGDEFAMILQDIDLEHARLVAERMQYLFNQRETYGTTMSIGIASFNGTETSEQFIHRADKALYRAKALGKNLVHIA